VVTLSLRSVATLLLLLLAGVAGAEDGAAKERVGGVDLGDPQWRRSHFSAAGGQGYYYASHLSPRTWTRAGDEHGYDRRHRSGGNEGSGYTSKRTYEARRYFRDRRYQRNRYFRDRRYKGQRY
jgi:hypothetical protein